MLSHTNDLYDCRASILNHILEHICFKLFENNFSTNTKTNYYQILTVFKEHSCPIYDISPHKLGPQTNSSQVCGLTSSLFSNTSFHPYNYFLKFSRILTL